MLFFACINLLSKCMNTIKGVVAAAAGHVWHSESAEPAVDPAEANVVQAVRMAEATSQAMWGSAHYCMQEPLEITQVGAAAGVGGKEEGAAGR